MRRPLVVVAMLLLAACTGGQIDPAKVAGAEQRADAVVQAADPVIDAACKAVANLDAGFRDVAAAGTVDAKGIAYEKSIMQVHDQLCGGGAPANVADALARLWYAASALAGLTPAATGKT
jgi:hypothetical protein